jgi:hypothetical protein
MGLWVNLGFITFIILLVLSGRARADEKPVLTPFSVCPLVDYRPVYHETEFSRFEDTLYYPAMWDFQRFTKIENVRKAAAFMAEHAESKRTILMNNRRQIRVLTGCMKDGGAVECADADMSRLVARYMGVDFKKALALFRVMEALAFRANYEDLYSRDAYWLIDAHINYKLEGNPGWGLLRVSQQALTAEERAMAEGFYFELWQTLAEETIQYLQSELKRPETDKYLAHRINRALQAIAAAKLMTDKTELIRAVSMTDMPGWGIALQERVAAFRGQMQKTWWETFNAFRVFAYVTEAQPTIDQIKVALKKMDDQARQEHWDLGQTILDYRQARTTGGSLFSISEEPMGLLQHTLARKPEHCRIASNLFYMSGRRDTQFAVIGGAVFVASFWLPQQIVIPLFIGIGGYNVYQSNVKFNSETDMFLSFMSDKEAFGSSDQVVFALTAKMFDELLMPLYLFGLPKSVRNAKVFLGR